MKPRSFLCLLLALVLILPFTACQKQDDADGKKEEQKEKEKDDEKEDESEEENNKEDKEQKEMEKKSPIAALDRMETYKAVGEEIFRFSSSDSEYHTIQGGCIVNGQFVVAIVKKDEEGYEKTRLVVMEMDGTVVRESEPMNLDHCNNLTYNKKIDKILASHCQSPDKHYNRYSLVDPKTFEITETKDLEYPFFSMAYCEKLDKYASGEWSGQTLDIWDGQLNNIMNEDVTTPNSLSQGVFCDEFGIYFVRSSQNGYEAEIRHYDWNTRLARTIPLKLQDSIEPESINIVGDDIYVIGTDWDKKEGVCFKLSLIKE